MRSGLVMAGVLLAVLPAMAARARGQAKPVKPRVPLVASYDPPAGDRAGDPVRGRAWTYDSAVTATARAASGDLDGAGALLDVLRRLQRPDGALEASYDTLTGEGAGPVRAGNQAWVGLAALEWRSRTCSRRNDRLLAGVADWLLGQRVADRASLAFGLVRGGQDVSWISTEHNLEARAFFAGLAAALAGRPVDPALGRSCPPGLDSVAPYAARALLKHAHEQVAEIDRAIDAALLVHDGPNAAYLRQGFGDDARPLDVQALGMLWLIGRGRATEAAAVARTTDATMAVSGRRPAVPRAFGQTFTGYRPFAGRGMPDVLWMEGTLMMRLAKARLGLDVAQLDDSADRWAALTAPGPVLQADRPAGEDYHAWPAAAPTAWLALSRSRFALLQ